MSRTTVEGARMASDDPFGLERFVRAQESVYGDVRDELRSGRKRTHWMWFIFPQVEGLGHSAMSVRYAIGSLDEARAYLAHGVLGERLRECSELVWANSGRSASDIFGCPDDMKLQSSMTLFAKASNPGSVFERVLEKYFEGQMDSATVDWLETMVDDEEFEPPAGLE
jgi:uncharacterized protein (DUF1810 family)